MAEVLESPEVIEQPASLRDTITDAITEIEPEDSPLRATDAPAPVGAEGQQPDGGKPAAPAETPAKPADPTAPVGKKEEAAPAVPQELKAPSQWKPHVREKWGTLPREVQEEIVRREGDTLRLIGSVGQKIKFADEVSQQLAPFAERLQGNNVPPNAFVADVFQTVKSLAQGSMEQKAAVVANIVQSYGIDLRMLDNVLAQRIHAPPVNPEVHQARQLAARAQAVLQQHSQGQERQAEESAASTLAAFSADPKNEFFNDVREMMADLLQAGRAPSLEDAYQACIWANPDTRKILLQREAQQRVTSRSDRAAQARRASSSVHGSPLHAGGGVAQNNGGSLRETIAAAFEAQDGA